MSTPLRTLLPLLSALGLLSATFADAQENSPRSLPVAILNLDVVFKEDPKVMEALAELKEKAAELDEKAKLRQSELEAVANDLRKAQPGSAEQRRLQQEAVKLDTELKQFFARERANLQNQEAKIFLARYKEIESVVKEYCQQQGIKLVIRQQATSLDENQPTQEIHKALNRIVVFEDGLDITADIRERLKAKDKE